jgi:hypothetical protein
VLADALARLARTTTITQLAERSDPETDKGRTKLPQSDQAEATITMLTSNNDEQSQRGSNPCLHLERVVS